MFKKVIRMETYLNNKSLYNTNMHDIVFGGLSILGIAMSQSQTPIAGSLTAGVLGLVLVTVGLAGLFHFGPDRIPEIKTPINA